MQITPFCIRHYQKATLKYSAALLAALSLSAAGAQAADTVFDQPDPNFNGRVMISGVAKPGEDVTVNGRGFKPGQEIQLLRSGQPIAKDKTVTADKDGNFSTTVAVPDTAVIGVHPVVVQVANPSAADIFEFKVSPDIPYSGADQFTITSEHLTPGLYEVAYSPASNALFVTASIGRPPAQQSSLLKVNPDTLKIDARATPGASTESEKGQVIAVYGVTVDDEAGTVWVTNTPYNSAAVYKQSDLSLVKQFPQGTVPHARDIVVDAKNHRAYVAAFGSSEIVVFDTQKLEPIGAIAVKSRTREAAKPMGLALDAANGKLYTVSLPTAEVFVIDLAKQEIENTFALPGAKSTIALAVAPEAGVLFVAAQGSDTVQLLDLKDGKVLHTVSVPAGPLNIAWNAKDKLAYTVSRGGNAISVIDLDGKIVANLDGGSYPNHIITDGKGTVYAVNKARGKDDKTGDHITRISKK